MEKLDLKKKYKAYYSATKTPAIIDAPSIMCLVITGQGEPAGESFNNKIEALYTLAYGVKKIYKLQGKDFAVPPMGGLWWLNGNKSVLEVHPSEWNWKLLIHLPDFVRHSIVEEAKAEVLKKKKLDLVKEVAFEKFEEGKSIQVLHIGPYTAEEPTVEKIRDLMKKENLKQNGHHHEIYLSDPRKVSPEKLKTIIRYPIIKAQGKSLKF